MQHRQTDDASKEEDSNDIVDPYVVRAMQSQEQPDHIRALFSASLLTLSDLIRKCPTLPADPSDPTRHLSESKSADCALKLPNAHCAVQGCAWTGVATDALVTHLQEQHLLSLQ